eukprot:TRINITY_DN1907_c0_g1_i3.p1 TRINITY_DN1907_c0_g1~~TRINITY_DN1907_c0_g1_i3.p1  ORF type:complete len:169 (+),score=44.38 TRINITY_DN1907_c0_g1_i3:580-1086(+)
MRIDEVYTWGSNNNYQLGYPCRSDKIKNPRKVYFSEENKYADMTSVKSVVISNVRTLALADTGELYTWGTDYDGKGYMVTPYKVHIDFEKDIKKSELTLSQSEYTALKKTAKSAIQHYQELKDESAWISKEKKKSGNGFATSAEYIAGRIAVHKMACSNKHSLIVRQE